MKASDNVERELEFARSRIIKNLEEGQNLLNRMRKRSPCTVEELLSMRSWYSEQQAAFEKPAERLHSVLAEEQFVYKWNYSLVLLSNRSNQFRSNHNGAKSADFQGTLALSVKARKLYVQGKLRAAADLVTKIIDELAP